MPLSHIRSFSLQASSLTCQSASVFPTIANHSRLGHRIGPKPYSRSAKHWLDDEKNNKDLVYSALRRTAALTDNRDRLRSLAVSSALLLFDARTDEELHVGGL